MSKKLKSSMFLLITAIIWGSSFVAQKEGMNLIGPLAYNGTRTIIGGIVLLPVIFAFKRQKSTDKSGVPETMESVTPEEKHANSKMLIIGGICCGLALCVGGNIQQIGLYYTTAGKSGFITTLYVVLVPLLGLLLKKRVRPVIWFCIMAAAVGLYFLCMPQGGGFGQINSGDLITLLSAFFFAIHILVVDYFSPKVDGVKLSCIQFFVCGIVSLMFMYPVDTALGFDMPTLGTMLGSWLPILYAGALSCGVGYTFQVLGQKYADPAVASMLLSLESVFAVITGMIVLGEVMSLREVIGCLIMFTAITVAQLPERKNRDLT